MDCRNNDDEKSGASTRVNKPDRNVLSCGGVEVPALLRKLTEINRRLKT